VWLKTQDNWLTTGKLVNQALWAKSSRCGTIKIAFGVGQFNNILVWLISLL